MSNKRSYKIKDINDSIIGIVPGHKPQNKPKPQAKSTLTKAESNLKDSLRKAEESVAHRSEVKERSTTNLALLALAKSLAETTDQVEAAKRRAAAAIAKEDKAARKAARK